MIQSDLIKYIKNIRKYVEVYNNAKRYWCYKISRIARKKFNLQLAGWKQL